MLKRTVITIEEGLTHFDNPSLIHRIDGIILSCEQAIYEPDEYTTRCTTFITNSEMKSSRLTKDDLIEHAIQRLVIKTTNEIEKHIVYMGKGGDA